MSDNSSSLVHGLPNLRKVGIGVVVEDKETNHNVIKVVLPAHVATQAGKVSEVDEEDVQVSIPNAAGDTKKESAKKNVTIKATWHKDDSSNRINAPDVYKHESVIIYKYADDDKYFWKDMGTEPKLRKQEHAVYAWSNVPSKNEEDRKKEYDLDTSYNFVVSSKEKKVTFHTADNDNEFTTWDLELDTKIGKLTVKDGKGNYVMIDSKEKLIEVNSKGTINLHADDEINLVAPKINIKGKDEVNILTRKLNSKASSTEMNSRGKFDINTPNVKCSSKLVAKKEVKSSVVKGKNVKASNDLSIRNRSIRRHTHGGIEPGTHNTKGMN